MDSDASQMEDQSEARADAPDSHADAPGSRADVPNSRAVSRSIFQSDFVGGLTIGAIYLIYHLPSISRFLYRLPGRAIMGLTWFAFGTFFRLVAFTPLLFGKRPVGYTGFCYLLLFPFYSRWLAALRLGAFPTGASLRNYIQDSMSKTYNVSHVDYEVQAENLHFYVPSRISYGSRVTSLDVIRRAELYVPNFDSIHVD